MKLGYTLILGAAACGTVASVNLDLGDRYISPEQAYSLVQPSGWTASTLHGFAQFKPTADVKRTGHTIMVRAAAKPHELSEGKPTTREDVIEATEKVLRALPNATLGATHPVENAELHGAHYSLRFLHSTRKTEFRRDHAVLVGSRHVYHVIYTAPASDAIDTGAFEQIVNTLREGV